MVNQDTESPESPHDQTADQATDSQWPNDPKSQLRRLEAVLFLSRKPLQSRKLSQLAHLEDGTQARTLVKQLNEHYDQQGRAFHIKRVGGGFQLRTRPQFADWIRRLDHVSRPPRLSNPALETLTVVAYRQPIIKAEIEAIRGVSCGEMLRQLLEKGLVKIAGRSEKLGRPFLYATTKQFLSDFGFNHLKELPRANELLGHGLPQWANSVENRATLNQDLNTSQTPTNTEPTSGEPASSQTKEEEE